METQKFTEEFDKMTFKVLIALGFIFVLSQTPLTADAATISVPGDHSTIQSALEFALPGDRIELSPGVYLEHGLNLPLFLKVISRL